MVEVNLDIQEINLDGDSLDTKKEISLNIDKDIGSVDLKEAFALHKWHPGGQLVVLKGANHVFGSHHPWDFSELPLYLQQIHSKITHFINNLC